ncbi:phosphoribosylanthranilate isomerase [Lacticaseibacillus parakribbianus]|uniref:phosphoribosylanthranilate isomerase n=1 Tax=Lacticaseibacillus parakribbianus TaxID=2970927 RepID=UPI0021CB807C|nr:phosphoribosylanthranilate isomerase [Lacticaseibacillus parakribbianus]
MSVQVKVCGLMTAADVAAVNAARPDYAGFVLAPGRHRVTVAQCRVLAAQLAPGIVPVAVLLSPDSQLIAGLRGVVAAVQLHRPCGAAAVVTLQRQGFLVMARVTAAAPETPADYALCDAGDGSGQALDWQALPATNRPLMLAGGLAADNVAAAIRLANPAVVDASSRLERAGGKDPALVAAFVAAAREVK